MRAIQDHDWGCCLPTADETTISLSCPLDPAEPWLAGRALDVLREVARVSSDPSRRRYAAGSRRSAPLILGEPLSWHELPMVLEACQAPRELFGELTLRLPPWSDLAERLPEDELWQVADRLCEEFGVKLAVVSDGATIGYPGGRAPREWARVLQLTHLGVLLPEEWLGSLRQGSNPYRQLERTDLLLVLE